MELKKLFEKPEIEVIKFDMKDVITDSPTAQTYVTSHDYDIDSLRGIFNIKV